VALIFKGILDGGQPHFWLASIAALTTANGQNDVERLGFRSGAPDPASAPS
jgi:hypothetical protein